MIEAHREREMKDLMKDMMKIQKDKIKERGLEAKLPKYASKFPTSGSGLKKGSKEAKEHMARIRAMKKN